MNMHPTGMQNLANKIAPYLGKAAGSAVNFAKTAKSSLGKGSQDMDAEIGDLAMERVKTQRDSMISQRNILTGGGDGFETT